MSRNQDMCYIYLNWSILRKQRTGYLIHLQFLGFRYSGWQKQPGQKTVEGMLVKTLKFVLPDRRFKILGAGRTDARVSAWDAAFELFLDGDPLRDLEDFLQRFNENLPADIRALGISSVGNDFNIIKDCSEKEYHYYFSYGKKNHPFAAPFMTGIPEVLDIERMKKAAALFVGTHDFRAYTAKSGKEKTFVRTVTTCAILPNSLLQANFFPESSYLLQIKGRGFIRYQVRMIMGALISLGKGELTLPDIKQSLKPANDMQLSGVAPGSGLLLYKVSFS